MKLEEMLFVLAAMLTVLIILWIIPMIVVRILWGKLVTTKSDVHACDKSFDGMCVKCQINAAKAFLGN